MLIAVLLIGLAQYLFTGDLKGSVELVSALLTILQIMGLL